MNMATQQPKDSGLVWPDKDFTRTPYGVFTDEDIFEREQELIFRGPTWHYLGLECEVKNPGDYLACYVGNTPVVLSRAKDDKLHAFVNRCTHRGGPIVRDLRGNTSDHKCIYHNWSFSSAGELRGVPFQRGVNGRPGYPDDFKKEDYNPLKLRVETHAGLVFGTFSQSVKSLTEYLGPAIRERLSAICHKPLKVVGYQRHPVRANWKLFGENTRDGYHGPLLHSLTAYGIFETSQRGSIESDAQGMHSLISAYITPQKELNGVPPPKRDFELEDKEIFSVYPELPNGLANSVISIFPSTLFTIVNTMSVRQIRPKSAGKFELVYTYFAFEDDDEVALARRRKQANNWGPSGYIAVEDTEILEQIQLRLVNKSDMSLLKMGGTSMEDENQLISESAVRKYWRAYCNMMNIPAGDQSAAV